MNFLAKLRARLQALQAELKAVVDPAEKEGRAMTAEEQAKWDGLFAEANTTKETIARMEKQTGFDAELNQSAGRASRPSSSSSIVTAAGGQPVIFQDPRCGFRDLGEFAVAAREAFNPGARNIDERLTAMAQAINAAPPSGGSHREQDSTDGYMVPPQFRDSIWELVDGGNDLLGMVDAEPTNSNAVGMLADESTPWGASGVQAYWAGEEKQFQPSKLATKARNVQLHKIYAFVLATDELLEDAPRLADRLTRQAARAIEWKTSEAIMRGDGVGKPLGWLNSAAKVTVAKEAGQAAASLDVQNIAKMYSRMFGASISRAVWLANSDIVPQLIGLKLGDHAIWTPPSAGLAQAPGGFLMGRPIVYTEHADTIGTEGDLQFVDPTGYYAARKTGTRFDRSIHLYFDYGLEAFRWTFRLGGQPYLSAPVSPAKGASTKSHFITLATRS